MLESYFWAFERGKRRGHCKTHTTHRIINVGEGVVGRVVDALEIQLMAKGPHWRPL
ncbi:MAG: hypothetical protein CM15mP83_0620 [Flavobacteriaceae bacterium]|nr:MAG: hypothetical protein CM15mP83_0620 [Flavobacteriaceae bacterium]